MIGGEALVRSLEASAVTHCFANPGTSELHLVAALERSSAIQGVLCLHEGVATGAADGFGRVTGRPAMTLLHQGVGLSNGLAGLHNARRASTPVVNVVGASATAHRALDGPLESDIAAIAGTVSSWVRTAEDAASVGADAAAACSAALGPPGQVATLIVPADVAWDCSATPAPPGPLRAPRPIAVEHVGDVARLVREADGVTVLVGGPALRAEGLAAAERLARTTHARVLVEAFPARADCGSGLPRLDRLSADATIARRQLAATRHLVLAGAPRPVAAFAQPDLPGTLAPPGCTTVSLAALGDDVTAALGELAARAAGPGTARLGAADPQRRAPPTPSRRSRADEPLTTETLARVVATLLPDGAIVVDEANTAGGPVRAALADARRHLQLSPSGFAIGHGLPMSVGAAVAAPDRKVVCLEADGSAMYTAPALWTQAREGLDIVTIVLDNRSYAILRREAERRLPDDRHTAASALFDLARPELDFVALATSMGVGASRARTPGELAERLARALAEPGPHLVDAVLPAAR